MRKKLRALICALTAGMMLTTSLGLTAFAEDLNADGSAKATESVLNADGSEAVATETPETVSGADVAEDEADAARLADEATAAEATPESTEVPKTYDSDTYYQNALKVCSALGIITGYDDGSVKPESTVTRAEMATIILRMIANSGTSTYQNIFTDVKGEHWAADTIQTAVEQGIVNGMGDGTFVPDGPVKHEQVIKMIVCAMNYGIDAENAGGYPQGYLAVGGSTLKLLTSVNGSSGADMPRGEVIKSVYNALKASYRGIKEFKNGYPVYETKDTLGIEKFDMYEEEGVLTTTPNITITSGSTTKDGIITIDGVDYKCEFNVDEYVATKVKFYYIDDKNDDNKVIAMFSMGRSTEYTFDAVDIESINTSTGKLNAYTSSTSSSTKKYEIKNATVIYNDTIMTTADYAAYKADKTRSANDTSTSFDDFINPAVGTVKIVDYDNDGTYDIIFVDSYETMLVTNSTSEKLTGKINNANVTIEYDLDDKAYEIKVFKNDVQASVKNLKKNDVASIKRNLDSDKMTIIVTGESITGAVSSIGTEDDEMTVTVNGQVYKVDENISKKHSTTSSTDLKSGVSGTFYLDQFDRIGYVDLESTLQEGENYAMITKAFYNDENELAIRLYIQEGKEIEAKPASGINAWLPGATSVSKPSETQLYNALSDEGKYVQAVDGANSYPVKLCTYKLNSAGEITKLYVAVGTSTTTSTSALTVFDGNGTKKASLKDTSAVGGTIAGYSIDDGIVEFSVPDDASERGNGANYSAGTVTASGYKSYDGGVSKVFAIGSFQNDRYPQVLVRFTTSASSLLKISDVDTASTLPGMIVSKISEGVDADGETVFTITGYQNGSEVAYTTTSHTGLYKFTGFNGREYNGTLLYDATSDDTGVFLKNISAGDIVMVAANGGILIKTVDVNDVAELAAKGSSSGLIQWPTGQSAINSASRLFYYIGLISDIDIEDSAFIGLRNYDGDSSSTLTYNSSSVFSYATITVNANGKVTNVKVDKTGGMEPGELIPFASGEKEFDFGQFNSLKGSMGNGYIIRVQLDID